MSTTVIDDPKGSLNTTLEHPASWSGVFAMSVCAFALIASEFLPVSLLTLIASDLRISEGMAGQGIAISGSAPTSATFKPELFLRACAISAI